jgi:hypothetical protein
LSQKFPTGQPFIGAQAGGPHVLLGAQKPDRQSASVQQVPAVPVRAQTVPLQYPEQHGGLVVHDEPMGQLSVQAPLPVSTPVSGVPVSRRVPVSRGASVGGVASRAETEPSWPESIGGTPPS